MTTLLFFDTETTGFTRSGVPADDPTQAHLVQIAAIEANEEGFVRNHMSFVVRCPIPIPQNVVDIHGITSEISLRDGVSERLALQLFKEMTGRADLLIGHGVSFDTEIIRLACARNSMVAPDKPTVCTKTAARMVVRSPSSAAMLAKGNKSFKAPTLGECVKHFFGTGFGEAHDAYADTRACLRVYFELVRQGHVAVPNGVAA